MGVFVEKDRAGAGPKFVVFVSRPGHKSDRTGSVRIVESADGAVASKRLDIVEAWKDEHREPVPQSHWRIVHQAEEAGSLIETLELCSIGVERAWRFVGVDDEMLRLGNVPSGSGR